MKQDSNGVGGYWLSDKVPSTDGKAVEIVS